MSSGTLLFIMVSVTVVVTRVFLFFVPVKSPTIRRFRIHHYMYGIVLGSIGMIVQCLALYAMGIGLLIDETTFLLIGGKTHRDNYSALSLAGTAILIVTIYVTRTALASMIH